MIIMMTVTVNNDKVNGSLMYYPMSNFYFGKTFALQKCNSEITMT